MIRVNSLASSVEQAVGEPLVDGGGAGYEGYATVGAETAGTPSGLTEDEHAGAHVPFVQVEFPVTVEVSGGAVA